MFDQLMNFAFTDHQPWQEGCLQLTENTSLRLELMILEWMSGAEKIWNFHLGFVSAFFNINHT